MVWVYFDSEPEDKEHSTSAKSNLCQSMVTQASTLIYWVSQRIIFATKFNMLIFCNKTYLPAVATDNSCKSILIHFAKNNDNMYK